ncbi:MAG: hypothetical protein HC822_11920 [Oscillochloris sp.]|nr:hypothetical protein [Oscillochloris sp.]
MSLPTGRPTQDGEALDLAAVYQAAGIPEAAQERVTRAVELLKTLPAETPRELKRTIVEASLKAFGLPVDEIIGASVSAALERCEAEAIKARGLAEAEAIRARALAEAEGQRAMADALAANEGVAQRLELERIRLQAHIEVGVAQARAMGEAVAAMDFRLYGTPETAQQILRLMSLTDGIGNLMQSAPAPLQELGGRLLDRFAPNGHGNGHGSAAITANETATANSDNSPMTMVAAMPLISAAAAVISRHLSAEDCARLSVRSAISAALSLADDIERADLLRAEGLLALMPQFAEQPVSQFLS